VKPFALPGSHPIAEAGASEIELRGRMRALGQPLIGL